MHHTLPFASCGVLPPVDPCCPLVHRYALIPLVDIILSVALGPFGSSSGLVKIYYERTSSKSWLPGWASEAEKYVLLSKGTSLLFGGPSLWGSIIKVS